MDSQSRKWTINHSTTGHWTTTYVKIHYELQVFQMQDGMAFISEMILNMQDNPGTTSVLQGIVDENSLNNNR